MDKVYKSFLPTKLDLLKALSSYNSARNNVFHTQMYKTPSFFGKLNERKIYTRAVLRFRCMLIKNEEQSAE